MSDEMKNCCPPETTAPKMEVHDATEGSKDIKPKTITTAHKRLSQDEFQRKVAMAAKAAAAFDMEKGAVVGAAGALPALARVGASGAAAAGKAAPWLSRLWGGAKSLATTGTLPSVANSTSKGWGTWLGKKLVGNRGLGDYLTNPAGLALAGGTFAMPYVGGAVHRLGSGLHSVADAMGSTVGLNNQSGQGGIGNVAGGGLIGAGLGGLAGAMMPGEEEYEDEDGRIRKRRGSMLAGALRGAGMGGLAGAGVGAGMNYLGKQSAAQDFGGTLAKQIKS